MDGWGRMNRAALDDAYQVRAYIPGGDDYPARWAKAAAAFRAAHPPETIPVGPAAVDLFRPEGEAAGLMVFVHGGYWHLFGREDWSHFAEGGLAQGYAVAMVGYPLAPGVRIAEITAHVARAIDAVAALVEGPIHLTGHSAGGHLAARMVMADAAPSCLDRIVACVPISPVTDLRPLVALSMNAELRLDTAEAVAESPCLGAPLPGRRIAVHVGEAERPSFHWQAKALATAWDVPLRIAAGRHHFDVIDALRDPGSALMADILG
ncbi:alpha/beta hydrolase [Jannaschia seohaensis]|uniref:Alpha/beta hydrolase family protein n=1 Tax=Jannaschia seohaensis TaxID=475081 RepID=A0A2Y9AU25_9RHOB|nr:alpha/beta hydrolase [Jannaschia seohaensis]PWJ19107.1 alpha/beta hydrolase family protein [Jannaschia seohaensis]SSA45739.1 alpha/beta hydrolase fold [Jannaschia seohaensis]